MIKTIIFDLGKVIIPFDFRRSYERLAPMCGYAAEKIPERLRTCDLVTRFETGLVEPREFVRQFGSTLGIDLAYEEFCEIWSSIFHHETLIPETMLEGLRESYRLLLLSNTNAIHWEMVRANYPLLRHFDEHVLSFRVGALKPSPLIFRAALEAAECEPGECFFTDDIPEFTAAARAMGIDAVTFESAGQIQRELRARGVEWESEKRSVQPSIDWQ